MDIEFAIVVFLYFVVIGFLLWCVWVARSPERLARLRERWGRRR